MKIKRNKKSYKWFLCGLILVVVLTISYRVSKANYRISNSIELTTGKVISSPYDFKIISMFIDGLEQDKDTIIPDNGYAINEEQSYCYKESKSNKDNNVKLYTDNLGSHIFKGISKGTKCILYFEKATVNKPATMEELLKNYYIHKKIRFSENKDFNVPYISETKQTVFIAPDGDNFSYYFAGNPTDNWVEFGGYYWRIIRINGDGSIRMIYQGTEPNATREGTQIIVNSSNTYAFNTLYNDNAYVGYWYQTGVLRGLQSPSNAYTELNNWFKNSNIKQGTAYFKLIDQDAGFCGDRQPSTSQTVINGSGGTGTTTTYYGAYVRLAPSGQAVTASTQKVEPTFNCADNDDLYTYSGAKEEAGNHKLENPVGMIIADEVAYAGMVFETGSSDNYLDTDKDYWTMSPCYFSGSAASVFVVTSDGYLGYPGVFSAFGVRPTINLKKDVQFIGDGTSSNPFTVS